MKNSQAVSTLKANGPISENAHCNVGFERLDFVIDTGKFPRLALTVAFVIWVLDQLAQLNGKVQINFRHCVVWWLGSWVSEQKKIIT